MIFIKSASPSAMTTDDSNSNVGAARLFSRLDLKHKTLDISSEDTDVQAFFSTEPASTSATSASKAPQGRKCARTTAASHVGNRNSEDEMGKLISAAYAISEEKAHQSDASRQQWALESCANHEQKAADHSADHERKSADQHANHEQEKELHGHRLHEKLEQHKHEQAMQDRHCKVAPESWVIGGSKVVSSKGLEGYEMFDPRNSRRENREKESA